MYISIIRADISHAATIAAIGKKSFREAFEHLFYSKGELFEYLERTYDPVKLAKSLRKSNNIYLLAKAGEEDAGFVKIRRRSLNPHIESEAQTELQKIYVLPRYQGKGVGAALMKEARLVTNEMGPGHLWLDTHISNERAIRLYEANGFKKIGKHFFTIGTQTFEYHVMALAIATKNYIALNT